MTRQTLEEPTRYESSPMFVAGSTINQTLPVGNSNIVLNTTPTNINDNGCFDIAQWAFIAPKAGRVLLTAQITVMNLSSIPSICSLIFVIGGVDVAPKLNTVDANYSNVTFVNTVIAEFNVGMSVYLKFYNDASPDLRTRAAEWGALATTLQGYYLT